MKRLTHYVVHWYQQGIMHGESVTPGAFQLKRRPFWKRLLYAPRAFQIHYEVNRDVGIGRWLSLKISLRMVWLALKPLKRM